MYYSQFGEDKVLAAIFKDKKDGLCIEVGANDGVNDSTTLHFEEIGWKCILVEPNPILCELIRKSRRATLIEAAASGCKGEVSLFVGEGAERAHGVSTINSTNEALEKIESYGFTYREIKVQAKTLDEMLGDLELDCEIDFISVDVEGHELEALKGFSLYRWRPKIILVEDNSNFESLIVSNYLKKYGYLRFMRTGVNDWYAHKGSADLVNLNSRLKYYIFALIAKAKSVLRKIPFLLNLKSFIIKNSRQ